jgi:hypothetical protein
MHEMRLRRAAGTRTAWDVLKAFFRPPTDSNSLSDIEAVERGEGRTVACLFRGLYGPYPRRFVQLGALDLTSSGAEWRPSWFGVRRKHWRITDTVTSAYVRPRDPETDRLSPNRT